MTIALSSPLLDPWSPCRLVDSIFNNLMESSSRGNDENEKFNRYVMQMVDKFEFFRIKSPKIFFEISFKDLDSETITHIDDYTKNCKTIEEKYRELDEIVTEVIARITKQAEPAILSRRINEDQILLKVALNSMRELVSFQ